MSLQVMSASEALPTKVAGMLSVWRQPKLLAMVVCLLVSGQRPLLCEGHIACLAGKACPLPLGRGELHTFDIAIVLVPRGVKPLDCTLLLFHRRQASVRLRIFLLLLLHLKKRFRWHGSHMDWS